MYKVKKGGDRRMSLLDRISERLDYNLPGPASPKIGLRTDVSFSRVENAIDDANSNIS
jgi:hypothetical protein